MNISYLSDYNPQTDPEFATRWANHWKQYHIESIELDELMTTRNNRSGIINTCLLYTSPSPRDMRRSRMPSSA